MIIQAGIKEIIYLSDKYKDTDQVKASKRMLDTAAHITYRQLKKVQREILLKLEADG